jgi:spermidine synthase
MAARATGRRDRPARARAAARAAQNDGAWSARTVTAPTDAALAEIVPEHGRPWRRLLRLDGEDASHVDLRDPSHLEFAYVRRLADACDLVAAPGAPVDAVHLGGGGFTLPRYVEATRPGSRQEVAEIDAALIALARAHLGLRPSPRLRVRAADGRRMLERRPRGGAHVVVLDAFVDLRVPERLATVEFARAARRALRPDGVLAANVVEPLPQLRDAPSAARPLAAALARAFPHLAVAGTRKVLRRRQGGNVVLLASARPLPLGALAARARRGPAPEVLLGGGDAAAFAAGARAATDAGATADRAAGG